MLSFNKMAHKTTNPLYPQKQQQKTKKHHKMVGSTVSKRATVGLVCSQEGFLHSFDPLSALQQ